MKKRLIFLHLLFMVAMIAIVLLVLADANHWFIIVLTLVGLGIVGMILKNWMDLLTVLHNKSSEALSVKNATKSKWSFDHLDQINKNHQLIKDKFKISAQLITDLAKDEQENTLSSDLLADDPIGEALQNIRSEMNKLKEDDAKRTWINQGIAQFSEILRNKSEVNEYSYQIISNLVKYVEANQGALFIEYTDESNERYLELAACYAYGRRKHVENKIYEGQGLIGQCMLEKELIFLTDIPKSYVKITSGLGESTPRNVIVVPLVFNETFYGAVELALFEIMQPHKVEFLEKICENIASEIASLNNIKNTQQLLKDSNELTLELQSSEEEMRQNIEELAATQEEMERKQSELSGVLNAIDGTLATAEFDMEGNFKSGNSIFCSMLHYKNEEIEGADFKVLMGDDIQNVMMWENLTLGKYFSGEFKMKDKNGYVLWLRGTFNPIVINGNTPQKVMMFAHFTTEEKEKVHDLNAVITAFKSSMPIMIFNEEFNCNSGNKMFLDLFELTRMKLKSKSILDFIDPYYHDVWETKKDELLEKGDLNVRLPIVFPSETIVYEGRIVALKNLDGKTVKIILLLIKEAQDEAPVLIASHN